jgi:hypothetical protein
MDEDLQYNLEQICKPVGSVFMPAAAAAGSDCPVKKNDHNQLQPRTFHSLLPIFPLQPDLMSVTEDTWRQGRQAASQAEDVLKLLGSPQPRLRRAGLQKGLLRCAGGLPSVPQLLLPAV